MIRVEKRNQFSFLSGSSVNWSIYGAFIGRGISQGVVGKVLILEFNCFWVGSGAKAPSTCGVNCAIRAEPDGG